MNGWCTDGRGASLEGGRRDSGAGGTVTGIVAAGDNGQPGIVHLDGGSLVVGSFAGPALDGAPPRRGQHMGRVFDGKFMGAAMNEAWPLQGVVVLKVVVGVGVMLLTAAAVGEVALPTSSLLLVGVVTLPAVVAIPGAAARRDGGAAASVTATSVGQRSALAELERSRRYERKFCLVRLERRQSVALSRGPGNSVSLREAAALAGAFRQTDAVWTQAGAVYGLLPETDGDSAHGLIARLVAEDSRLTGVEARVAEFPSNGLTLPALIAAMDQQKQYSEERRAS